MAGQPWRPDGLATDPYLDYFSDDTAGLFTELLDPQTLNAVALAVPSSLPPPANETTRKRIAADTDDSDDEGKPDGQPGKRSKADSRDAARTKASREKARREKINDRFTELAKLVDPSSEPKSDKPSILADAIKHVQQLRVENHQLKQLNKFLEEKVAVIARDKDQQAYQHHLWGGGMLPGLMPHGMHMPGAHLSSMPSTSLAGPSMSGPSGAHSSGPAPMLLPMHAAHAAAHAAAAAAHHAAANGSAPGSSMHHMAPQGHMPGSVPDQYTAIAAAASASMHAQPPMHHPGTASTPTPHQIALSTNPALAAAAGYEAASAAGSGGGKGLFMGMGQPMGMGGAAAPPQQHWVPPTMLDSNQDSLLRPPAA